MSTTTTPAFEIDVRTIPPYERHARIFGQFDDLEIGQALVIVNDHDPVPLHRQFDARSPGQFQWNYLQAGPQLWRVQIDKVASQADSGGGCCSGGACG
ncbi:DUF2249 domain-containing protein [Pulveribacter suum]|uniref:Aminotransferase n=1 Tax=Pulveribacter suum TaxID=2116657 RepID=A0A2P1NLT9_9BURK|nr:DUF2249 domain-containing protein [Pulveribacter suum]AVP58021.1 aminotransferase [Pulveribacter suum]